jgi:hypothetical protein
VVSPGFACWRVIRQIKLLVDVEIGANGIDGGNCRQNGAAGSKQITNLGLRGAGNAIHGRSDLREIEI